MKAPKLSVQQLMATADGFAQVGRFEQAVPAYEQVLAVQPRNTRAMAQLGYALMARGRFAEAKAVLKKAMAIPPTDAAAVMHMGLVCNAEGNYAEALEWFDRALALRPGEPATIGAKAEIFCITGEYDRAMELLEREIGRGGAGPARPELALTFARVCDKLGQRERGIDVVRRSLERTDMTQVTRALLLFRLGDLHDAVGEYDAAFAAFSEGHRLRSTGRWDPDACSRDVDAVIAAWTPEAVRGAPSGADAADLPVLVVGMWRSGTTLAEQILSAHPEVFGGDELNDLAQMVKRWPGARGREVPMLPDPSALTPERVAAQAEAYLGKLRGLGGAAARVTDKMPINFLYLGLAAKLVPGVRVIHCVRNPLDTCVSCYAKLLAGGMTEYAHDLRHLGRFYRDYQRLIAHWKSVLEVPILDVRYEQIVEDAEGQARRMIEFLGLGWDPACLRFHENRRVARTASLDQVRRPLYRSSVERWRNYERHLGPLIETLEAK